MNILFFLTPKAACTWVYDDFSIRQAMEKLQSSSYTALPILSRSGGYRGAITEGDLLWALKDSCGLDMKKAEDIKIMSVPHRQDNLPVSVSTDIADLVHTARDQNFVPVVDDRDMFIGIVTRSAIIEYFEKVHVES